MVNLKKKKTNILKKINLFIILIFSFSLIISNSQAFLYGSIFSMESLNIVKENKIELSPEYNSRTICLVRQKQYNRDFPKYIRSTCFEQQAIPGKYFYLICNKQNFSNCDTDTYLGDPINVDALKEEQGIYNPNKVKQDLLKEKDKKNTALIGNIYNSVGEIFNNQKIEGLDKRSMLTYDFIDKYFQRYGKDTEKLEKFNTFIQELHQKQKINYIISVEKKYNFKEIRFVNDSDNTYYSLTDFIEKKIPDDILNKIHTIKIVFFDELSLKEYTLRVKFSKNLTSSNQGNNKDYNIEEIVNGIFTDTETGKDYNIEEIINGFFSTNNNDLSIGEILGLVFENGEEVKDIVKMEPEPESEQGEIGLDEILKSIFSEDT